MEPLSLDEAYLDVTGDKQDIGSAIEIATRIRIAIRDELQLTASAGVSVSKFVAKIASDMNKPDGLTFIAPLQVVDFMAALPVEKFYGVGRVTAEKMKGMGLHTGAHLKALSEDDLIRHFGKSGSFYHRIVRGIDQRPVRPHRETKSVGAEDTFPYDLKEAAEQIKELQTLAGKVSERLVRHNLSGRTVTLKIKFPDFRQITRARSLARPVDDAATIAATAIALLNETDTGNAGIRLLGVTVSGFGETAEKKKPVSGTVQLGLFEGEL